MAYTEKGLVLGQEQTSNPETFSKWQQRLRKATIVLLGSCIIYENTELHTPLFDAQPVKPFYIVWNKRNKLWLERSKQRKLSQ